MNKIVIEWNEGMGKIRKRVYKDFKEFTEKVQKPEDMFAEPQVELDERGNQ